MANAFLQAVVYTHALPAIALREEGEVPLRGYDSPLWPFAPSLSALSAGVSYSLQPNAS
jgi:hypothetical protein